jgi:hypothetical protein
VQALGFS